jgi:hypothetical protein
VAARPVRDPRGRVIARYAVEAGVVVPLPRATAVVGPSGRAQRGVMVGLRGRFDESTGKAGAEVPLRREVRTRVSVVSVEPQAPR